MTVRTTYFSALSHGLVEPDTDAKVFAVVREPAAWTEQLVDRNVPAVAPPEELLDAFKRVEEAAAENGEDDPSRVAWESVQFAERYREHLDSHALRPVLASLRATAQRATLWLVCYEKDERWCHRRLLADRLRPDLGIPQRPRLDDACSPDEHDLVRPPGIPTRVCQHCGLGSTTLDTHLGHLGGVDE
jgi:uncharacterized protein YeaO (DUF488 family)